MEVMRVGEFLNLFEKQLLKLMLMYCFLGIRYMKKRSSKH